MKDDNPATSMRGLPPRRRAPWWAYLVAASCLITFAFNIYTSHTGYGHAGAAMSDATKGGTLIEEVVPGKPLEKAGVRAGDIVVAVDGQAIRNAHDWYEMSWQFELGKPIVLTVERASQQMQLTMLFPQRRVWQMWTRSQWLDYGPSGEVALLYLAMGLVVLFARPRDPGAVAGAVLLLIFASFLAPADGTGNAVLFQQLPFLLQAPVFIVTTLLGGYLILIFSALYPRPAFRRRWVLPALLVPGLLMIPNNVIRLYHRFYMPSQISPGPPWAFRLQLAVEMANILAGLIVCALGYKRLKDAHERRGLRRVSFAALISFGTLLVVFWVLSSEPTSPVLRLVFGSAATGFVLLLLLFLSSIFPVVFAYTVLRTGRRPASGGL